MFGSSLRFADIEYNCSQLVTEAETGFGTFNMF